MITKQIDAFDELEIAQPSIECAACGQPFDMQSSTVLMYCADCVDKFTASSSNVTGRKRKTPGSKLPGFGDVYNSRSPLAYVGGKRFAVPIVDALVPRSVRRIMSPFIGGGSIELHFAARGVNVQAYDAFTPLVHFWRAASESGGASIVKVARQYAVDVVDVKSLGAIRERIKEIVASDDIDTLLLGSLYLVVNTCAFSGGGLASGYSSNRKMQADYTLAYLEAFNYPPTLHVSESHFAKSIPAHQGDFIYADPPYDIASTLYGYSGELHRTFSHEKLAELLCAHDGGFLLSYNDTERIRSLYSDYPIISLYKRKGMQITSNNRQAEIIIDGRTAQQRRQCDF